jgi:raffinose/stachyose/melibiose transport system permease protein
LIRQRSRSRRSRRVYSPLNDIAGVLTPYLYAGPTVLFIVVFLIYPMINVFWYSLVAWSGFGPKQFIGLRNYGTLLTDPVFWSSFRTNAIYVLFFSLAPTVLGLFFASLIGRSRVPGERYFRAILLMPQVMASVAMGVIFRWIFSPGFGFVNDLLNKVGLERWERPWLGDSTLAPIAVGSVGTWLWLGFVVIVFVAGIQKIDPDLYDAANLDGAGSWQQLRFITLPELRAEVVVVLVVTLIRAFGSGVFGIVAAITDGRYNTMPLALYAYRVAFVHNRMGYGAAVTVFLVVLILLASALTFRFGERGAR